MRVSAWMLIGILLWSVHATAQEGTTKSPAAPSVAPKDGGGPVPDASRDLFVQKCASCHTVGEGARIGPDLKGVHTRRDGKWLAQMIQAPSGLLDTDPEARKLLAEYKNVRMPDLGLSDAQVALVVELLGVCSEQPCDLKGKMVPVTNATADDVARGVSLFLGTTPLKSGGPACVSCHALQGAGSILGGGTLSKDLTHAFATLGDEGLDAALKNPTFIVMNKVYGDKPLEADEVFALRAALYEANRGMLAGSRGTPAPGGKELSVVLVAALGSILSLVGLSAAWSRRKHQGIREALLEKEQQS